MQQITASKKYTNGIQVFWSEAGNERYDFFSYEDLVEQKINAFDLLENPRSYRMNVPGHTIESAVPGCDLDTCEGEIVITRLVGKWKTSQNQPASNREGVAHGLRGLGGEEAIAMADLVDAARPSR